MQENLGRNLRSGDLAARSGQVVIHICYLDVTLFLNKIFCRKADGLGTEHLHALSYIN